jgi:hypothetical protein
MAAAMPAEVIDLDVEARLGDTEVGMDDFAAGELEPTLPLERWESMTSKRPFETQLVVGLHRTSPRRATRDDLGDPPAPRPAALGDAASEAPQGRDHEVSALEALFDERFEVVVSKHRSGIEGRSWWTGDATAIRSLNNIAGRQVTGPVHAHSGRLIDSAMFRNPHMNVWTSGRLAQVPHCAGRREAHDSACERAREGDAMVQAVGPAGGHEHPAAGAHETPARNERANRSIGDSGTVESGARRHPVARLEFCCKSRFVDRHISSSSGTEVGGSR